MNRALIAFVSGLVFGVGLLVSQMSNPAKVIGFLDVTGRWDPSLAFVMAGAVVVFGAVYQLSRKRIRPVAAGEFSTPAQRKVDGSLVVGALIFGAGWGLSGFCPGPAVVSAAFGDARVGVFLAAMVAGIVLFQLGLHRLASRAPG